MFDAPVSMGETCSYISMDESSKPQQNPIDLSSLDGLTLGTAWTEASAGNPAQGERTERRGPRPFNGDRPFGGGRPFNRDSRGPRDFKPGAPRSGGQRPDFRRPDFRDQQRPAPIVPPSVKVVFYPEEAPFKALTKAVKASKRTYELFEISRLMLEKAERSAATLTHKQEAEGKPAPLYQCVADGAVFMTESEALAHACQNSLEKFFKAEEVEGEAPKGNFVVIHKCGITGKLIAPPNYHRYGQLLAEHQAKHLPNMALPAVQARLESVKEPEAIAQWLESMKKITRYTLLNPVEGQPASFDGADAAATHLSTHFKDQLVKAQPQVRLSGKQVEALPEGEIKRSIEVARAMQMKFPLDTANALRGRLRRMGFNIYKRGQKGVSYIAAVKRRFRTEGQIFAPEVQQVIEFIEKTPNVQDSELPKQILGITLPAPAAEGQPAATTLSPEEDAALRQLRQTLGWLIEQGYVIHFGNGALFVPPARAANAPKGEDEEEEPAAAEAAEAPEASTEAPAPEKPTEGTPQA